MGGGGGKAPATPDYTTLAKLQSKEQNALIDKQTAANRPNQVTPWGQIQWSQDEKGNWTQNVQYDPSIVANQQKLMQLQGQNLDAAAGAGPFDPTAAGTVKQFSPYEMTTGQYTAEGADKYADAFTKNLLARIVPQQQVDQKALATQLRLQGLQPGSEAYDRAYQNMLKAHGDVNSKAALEGMLYGNQESRADYNTRLGYDAAAAANNAQNQTISNATQQQGWDQYLQGFLAPYQAATAAGQVSTMAPDFSGFNPAGVGQATDVVGAAQQAYAQQMQNYNQKQQAKSSKGSSIGTLVGGAAGFMVGGPAGAAAGASLGGAAGSSFSDFTLKYDIQPIDDEEAFERLRDIVPASWKWNDTTIPDSGVIAQDLADKIPELVELTTNGKLAVNYSGLFALLQGAFRHMAKEMCNVR